MMETYTQSPPPVPVNLAAPRPKTPAQISHLYELALTGIAMSFHEGALETLQQVTLFAPDHAGAWRALAGLLRLADRDAEANRAQSEADKLAGVATAWRDAEGERSALRLARLDARLKDELEQIPDEQRIGYLRDLLVEDPLDVPAMRYLAREETLADDDITAGQLLRRALSLSPAYLAARNDYVTMLFKQQDYLGLLRQTEFLMAAEPDTLIHRIRHADAAVRVGRLDVAAPLFESVLRQQPNNVPVLAAYGSMLKSMGRREESVRTYRRILSLSPEYGAAYFGLSELKADCLTDADVRAMRSYIGKGTGDIQSRKCIGYALGQALERTGQYKESFQAYEFAGFACQEEIAGTNRAYNPTMFEGRLDRLRQAFTAENVATRAAPLPATPATTPIFIIGMPRSGSTLVEQILASHSMVEGTQELPLVSDLTKKIARSRVMVNNDVYPQRLFAFERAELDALGQEYLDGIAAYRKTTLPYVVDKRPWNWIDACFIHLILPQARFIDIRRSPMAAGFAMFKQFLPPDAAFSYDLAHVGHYYRQYVGFMDDMDRVMPGKILRVQYTDLVNDTETQIRRILVYCGLPFEESCLRFWETDRAVSTPSAEQVRQPIFRSALEQWKNYAPWLRPLKDALGDLAEA